MTDRGTYVEHDGRPAVRFERTYAHPAETVWAAVTESGRLAHWFPGPIDIEPRSGGAVSFGAGLEPGTVLTWDPPRAVAFTWGGAELHLHVTPAGADASTLVLVNVLEARDEAARNAAGWSVCLAELDKHLAGERADGPHSATASAWQPLYDAYVADGLPAGAPIPGAATA